MSVSADTLLQQALQLPLEERAALVESVLASIDQPDPSLDALWLKEAERRMEAYRAGELDAVDAEEVFAKFGKEA